MNLRNEIRESTLEKPYHIGERKLDGTVPYMDPILVEAYFRCIGKPLSDSKEDRSETFDIYKADVFSLGLTLLKMLLQDMPDKKFYKLN